MLARAHLLPADTSRARRAQHPHDLEQERVGKTRAMEGTMHPIVTILVGVAARLTAGYIINNRISPRKFESIQNYEKLATKYLRSPSWLVPSPTEHSSHAARRRQ